MSKSNTLETELLALFFNGTTAANIAQNASSAPLTNLVVHLHTADPGEAGTQSTNQVSYTGYAGVTVARSGAGWTVSGNTASNAAAITFGACTAGSATATHFSVGDSTRFYSGTLTDPLAISTGITPEFAIGALTVTED